MPMYRLNWRLLGRVLSDKYCIFRTNLNIKNGPTVRFVPFLLDSHLANARFPTSETAETFPHEEPGAGACFAGESVRRLWKA